MQEAVCHQRKRIHTLNFVCGVCGHRWHSDEPFPVYTLAEWLAKGQEFSEWPLSDGTPFGQLNRDLLDSEIAQIAAVFAEQKIQALNLKTTLAEITVTTEDLAKQILDAYKGGKSIH